MRLADVRHGLVALVLMVASILLAVPVAALDTLQVGVDELNWLQLAQQTSHVQVAQDSIWTWNTAAGRNLVQGCTRRGGGIRANANYSGGYRWLALPGLEWLADGNPGTA